MTVTATRAERQPLPADFRQLVTAPPLAWPTVALFVACLSGLAGVSALVLQQLMPMWLGTLVNGVIVYFLFSSAHDAAHGAVSQHRMLNNAIGSVSLLFFGPVATLSLARWIHTQHHRFTNDPVRDPDHFGHQMDIWMPLRWANFDYFYTSYFLKHAGPEKTRKFLPGLVFQISLVIGLVALAFHMGYGWEAVMLWLVPSRISSMLFVTMFVYLPHAPFTATSQQDEYRASNIRAGWEWLLTPLMTCQNYHLVHHLYPTAPFYRMQRIWQARLAHHLSKRPYFVGTFSVGKEVPPPQA